MGKLDQVKLLLFSGGIESTCLAAIHRPDLLVTLDYGHLPAAGEITAAKQIAETLELDHTVLTARLTEFGRGEMAGMRASNSDQVPEHWPFRNQMLVTLAAMKYADMGFTEIMLGTVVSDCVHSDGTPDFIARLNDLIGVQIPGLQITAPAIGMSTRQLVEASGLASDALGWCFSCHRASIACGSCRGCTKTLELLSTLAKDTKSKPVCN